MKIRKRHFLFRFLRNLTCNIIQIFVRISNKLKCQTETLVVVSFNELVRLNPRTEQRVDAVHAVDAAKEKFFKKLCRSLPKACSSSIKKSSSCFVAIVCGFCSARKILLSASKFQICWVWRNCDFAVWANFWIGSCSTVNILLWKLLIFEMQKRNFLLNLWKHLFLVVFVGMCISKSEEQDFWWSCFACKSFNKHKVRF